MRLEAALFLVAIQLFGKVVCDDANPENDTSRRTLSLYHRYVPMIESNPTTPWKKRGLLHVNNDEDEAWLDSSEETAADIFAGGRLVEGQGRVLYQLGIGRGKDVSSVNMVSSEDGQKKLSFISLDSCILYRSRRKTFDETLTLHLSDKPHSNFIHFNYYTNSLEGCGSGGADAAKLDFGPSSQGANFIVKIDRGYTPEPVRYPPPKVVELTPEGKIKVPVPEKSFLQKYWMYLVPVLLILMVAPGEDPGEQPAAK